VAFNTQGKMATVIKQHWQHKNKGDGEKTKKKIADLQEQINSAYQNDASTRIKKQQQKLTKILEAIKLASQPASKIVYEARKTNLCTKLNDVKILHEDIMINNEDIPTSL
jgi:ABC-type Fe2+-enterobactin transport system substrate-binding protein